MKKIVYLVCQDHAALGVSIYNIACNKCDNICVLHIHRQLHFINNSLLSLPGSHNYDKIGKERHVLNLIGKRFLAVYNPHCQCTINGAMIPYKG